MSKLNDTLSEVLDVEPIPEENTAITVVEETPVILSGSVVETDTEFARTNIRSLIQKGNTAIDKILQVADASEHPRAYEVAAGFIKTISDLNKDLLQLQKTKKELEPKQVDGPKSINVDKAVFIGSTADLLKQIKESR